MAGDRASGPRQRNPSHKRICKSNDLALTQFQQAVDAQVSVVHLCLDQLTEASSERQQKLAHVTTSNEVKKLQAILSQLDSLETRLTADQVVVAAPTLKQIRRQVDECVDLVSKACQPLYSGLCLDPVSERDGESLRSDVSVGDEVEKICDLEADVKGRRQQQRSWNQLETDLVDLNEAVSNFSQQVWTQKAATDRIDSNISAARIDLQSGAVVLSKISKKGALPLLGAAIGTAVCGPIGMLLGYKVAAVACLGTATVGYLGGRAVEKQTAPPAITRPEDSVVDEERAWDR